jgi:primosomal protein N' (replication factor Y)
MPDRHASTATLPLDPSPDGDAAPGTAAARRVQVLLPLPLTGPYDYLAPAELAVAPGSVVRVPLARRELVGVV